MVSVLSSVSRRAVVGRVGLFVKTGARRDGVLATALGPMHCCVVKATRHWSVARRMATAVRLVLEWCTGMVHPRVADRCWSPIPGPRRRTPNDSERFGHVCPATCGQANPPRRSRQADTAPCAPGPGGAPVRCRTAARPHRPPGATTGREARSAAPCWQRARNDRSPARRSASKARPGRKRRRTPPGASASPASPGRRVTLSVRALGFRPASQAVTVGTNNVRFVLSAARGRAESGRRHRHGGRRAAALPRHVGRHRQRR